MRPFAPSAIHCPPPPPRSLPIGVHRAPIARSVEVPHREPVHPMEIRCLLVPPCRNVLQLKRRAEVVETPLADEACDAVAAEEAEGEEQAQPKLPTIKEMIKDKVLKPGPGVLKVRGVEDSVADLADDGVITFKGDPYATLRV